MKKTDKKRTTTNTDITSVLTKVKYRLSGISGMEWWNGTVEWNTGMTFELKLVPTEKVSGADLGGVGAREPGATLW